MNPDGSCPICDEFGCAGHLYPESSQSTSKQLDRIEAKLDQLLAKKKPSKPRSSKKHVYDDKFEAIWEDCPKVAGANKADTYAQYKKRLSGTDRPLQLSVNIHIAVIKYVEFCKATSRWLMSPQAFMGHKKHYLSDWTVPKKKPSEDPDKQREKTFDPDAKVVVPDGVNPYEGMV